MGRKFCAHCGVVLQEEARFCSECGKPIQTEKEPSNASEEQAATSPSYSEDRKQHLNVVEQDSYQIGVGQHQNEEQAPSQEQALSEDQGTVSSGDRSVVSYASVPRILTNPIAFVALYIVAIIPTYILPYVGSNSVVVNAIGNAFAGAYPPSFWLHLASLFLAIVIAWFRGIYTNRAWIAILPFFATVFDMVPGFNWIFLVPTMFHIASMILGVSGKLTENQVPKLQFNGSVAVLAVLCVMAVVANTKQKAAIEEKFIAPNRNTTITPQPRTSIESPIHRRNLNHTSVPMESPPGSLKVTHKCLLYKCEGMGSIQGSRPVPVYGDPYGEDRSRLIGYTDINTTYEPFNASVTTVRPTIFELLVSIASDQNPSYTYPVGARLYFYTPWGEGCNTTWFNGVMYGVADNKVKLDKINCLSFSALDDGAAKYKTIQIGIYKKWYLVRLDNKKFGWIKWEDSSHKWVN